MAIKFNHLPENASSKELYGVEFSTMTDSVTKFVKEAFDENFTTNLTEDEKEHLVIFVAHYLELESQAAGLLILGKTKLEELLEKSISRFVEDILPHKERYIELVACSLIAFTSRNSN